MTAESFEQIAQLLRPKLHAVGRRFFVDDSRADDVVQEVLMRLWLMRDRLCVEQGVESLAVRMAKNYCVNEWRREQRRLEFMKEQEDDEERSVGSSADNLLDQDIRPDSLSPSPDSLRSRERSLGPSAILHSLEKSLSPYERRLLRLRYEWDMSPAEIAAIMDISPRSVSSIVSTAKRKLKEQLKKGGLP